MESPGSDRISGDGGGFGRLAFAHLRLRALDLVRESFVVGTERSRFLPIFERLRDAIQLRVGIANVLENYRIIAHQSLGRVQQISEGLLIFALPEMDPAAAIKESAVLGIEFERFFLAPGSLRRIWQVL